MSKGAKKMAKTKVGTIGFQELHKEAARLQRAAARITAVAKGMQDSGIDRMDAGYAEVYKNTITSVVNIAIALEEAIDEARLIPTNAGTVPKIVATHGDEQPRMAKTQKTQRRSK